MFCVLGRNNGSWSYEIFGKIHVVMMEGEIVKVYRNVLHGCTYWLYNYMYMYIHHYMY